eukprot:s318_g9.t1
MMGPWSTSYLSPAYSPEEKAIFSWVGVIMYITEKEEEAIRAKFREYAKEHAALTFKYDGFFHWGKVDLSFHEGPAARAVLREQLPGLPCRVLAMLHMLRWFASAQIRNVAVLAGNIATASPISDMNPVLMALGASVLLASAAAEPREVLLTDFFKSYRVVDMQPEEVICSIKVPAPESEFEFVRSFKQARV